MKVFTLCYWYLFSIVLSFCLSALLTVASISVSNREYQTGEICCHELGMERVADLIRFFLTARFLVFLSTLACSLLLIFHYQMQVPLARMLLAAAWLIFWAIWEMVGEVVKVFVKSVDMSKDDPHAREGEPSQEKTDQ